MCGYLLWVVNLIRSFCMYCYFISSFLSVDCVVFDRIFNIVLMFYLFCILSLVIN